MSLTSRHPEFDRSRLRLAPLSERTHDVDLSVVCDLARPTAVDPALTEVGRRIRAARAAGAPVVLFMGGHVVRAGVQRFLIDLMRRGLVSCLAMNGAVAIHDFELALCGGTTECVARYIKDGRFGNWLETGRLNAVAKAAAAEGLGLGEAVGREISTQGFHHREVSVLAAAWDLGVLSTVHAALGQDIVHQHPDCDGAAWGAATYRDFLRLTHVIEGLEGGVVMNFGSAVMAPEVFLKALSMARNVAAGEGREIRRFTTLVCDLAPLPEDITAEADKGDHRYYFRPWKTMLVRTVADGGAGYYVRGNHRDTVPGLWDACVYGEEV
jgi:hypothetical protein